MKQVSLANSADKAGGVFSLLVVAALSTLLLLVSSGVVFWMVLAGGVLAALFLGAYTAAVFTASALVDQRRRTVIVRGINSGTYDVTGAVSVCTEEVLLGSLTSRRILFLDAQGRVAASVATLMTGNRVAGAERAAKELASVLGLSFVPAADKAPAGAKKRRGEAAEESCLREEKRSINYDELDDMR